MTGDGPRGCCLEGLGGLPEYVSSATPAHQRVLPPSAWLLQIVRHVEAWDVSSWQALLLLLRPSEQAVWRRSGS